MRLAGRIEELARLKGHITEGGEDPLETTTLRTLFGVCDLAPGCLRQAG
ncbi:MAG TPA: hypothetical protein VGS01_06225 [Candidatus Limnocylindria bacterium]|nr:hypothetical protein [Candidatus Limnocylindria bacterium]